MNAVDPLPGGRFEKLAVECAHGQGQPYALHICGNTNLILYDMLQSGADALELDFKTDTNLVREKLEGRAAFIGNIDPNGVLALGNPQLVETRTRELLACLRKPALYPECRLCNSADDPAGKHPEHDPDCAWLAGRAFVRTERLRSEVGPPAVTDVGALRRS